jgi:hypothetical protein
MKHAGHDADLAGVKQEAEIAARRDVACRIGREGAGTNQKLDHDNTPLTRHALGNASARREGRRRFAPDAAKD